MAKYTEDGDYSEAIREQIVESDLQAFAEARSVAVGARDTYLQIYDFGFKNWDNLDRPVGGQQSVMHA